MPTSGRRHTKQAALRAFRMKLMPCARDLFTVMEIAGLRTCTTTISCGPRLLLSEPMGQLGTRNGCQTRKQISTRYIAADWQVMAVFIGILTTVIKIPRPTGRL